MSGTQTFTEESSIRPSASEYSVSELDTHQVENSDTAALLMLGENRVLRETMITNPLLEQGTSILD
jgi:hypothetical protein